MVTVWVVVALVNYSVVQSLVGSVASSYFTREWGGKVSIGSMGCNPFNHLVLRNVELINPENDTICTANTIVARFKRFPFDGHGITLSRLRLKDTYYHLGIDSAGLNLKYIFDYFKSDKESTPVGDFVVVVDDLFFDDVCYRQDLKTSSTHVYGGSGVDIPHMEWNHIRGRFRNVRVDATHGPYVTCRIDKFTTQERSGLEVKKMQMNVYVGPTGISATNMVLETADSHLEGDVLLDFASWKTMSHFLDSVYFTVEFKEGSWGGMGDAAYWARALKGQTARAYISGRFSGPLHDFHANNMRVGTGKDTEVWLDARISGLPHIDSTRFVADIHRLYTTYEDYKATGFELKGKAGDILEKLEFVDMSGTFDGTLSDFVASAEITTRQGPVKGDVSVSDLAGERKKNVVRYTCKLSSDAFAIGEVAPNEWVTRGGFDLSLHGKGLNPKTMTASADARLHNIVLRGQHLASAGTLELSASDGTATATFDIDDPLASLVAEASAEWREAGPAYRAALSVAHIDLKRLNMWTDTSDREAVISFNANGRYATLSDVRNFARLSVEGLRFKTTDKDYRMKNMVITAREQNKWRNVTLNSDILNAQMHGYFEPAGFGQMWSKFASDYLPQVLLGDSKKPAVAKDDNYDKIAGAMFELNIEWADSTRLLETFYPQLSVAHGTTLQTNYNFTECFKPLLRSDSIRWGSTTFYNVGADGESIGSIYRVRLTTDEIKSGQLVLTDNSDLVVESSPANAALHLTWENSNVAIGGGDVGVRLFSDTATFQTVNADPDQVYATRVIVDPSLMELGGRTWNINGSASLTPSFKGEADLRIESEEHRLTAVAHKLGRSDDEVSVQLVDFGLDILEPLLSSKGLLVTGVADGSVNLGGLSEVPYLNGDLTIDGLAFNGEELGDARVRSTWNAEMNQLNLYVSTDKSLQATGYVTLGTDDPELNFMASLDKISLKSISPFVKSFSSNIDGTAGFDLSIEGSASHPDVRGFVSLDQAALLIDFLGVRYSITDTIYVENEVVRFDDVEIHDGAGGKAYADGSIVISSLNDMSLDLSLHSDGMLCMNTTARQSSGYYGTIKASLDGTVEGTIKDIDINIDATTLAGSELGIPIDDSKQVKSADYIYFVGQDDYYTDYGAGDRSADIPGPVIESQTADGSKFRLTLNIEGTPDLQMNIPMRTSAVDADVKARGRGDLQMRISSENPFSLLGDYELNNGTISLNILGLRSWDFTIDDGSTINFPGIISNAMFDISAAYSQRVNMVTLTGSLASGEMQKMINVENVIQLSGTISDPTIGFDIRLPNSDQSVQEEVFAYIDRSNERDMINQTMSLLLLNRFYSSSTSTVEQTSVADESYGIMANSLGSLVSSMVDFVDVNFDYKAGNALTTDQIALDISKEWNKFYFETTVGFGGEAREMDNVSTNNNMTGDMLVGYKINPRLHLFVFNRSNTNDYTRSDLPYKQGLGIKYTRDFDNFKELFKKK